jgi:hypothetical protein
MGDMTDMHAESYWEDFSYHDVEEFHQPKQITCKFCKRKTNWNVVVGRWVMFNPNGTLHSCKKTNTPVEILREMALLKIKEVNQVTYKKLAKKILYNEEFDYKTLENHQLLYVLKEIGYLREDEESWSIHLHDTAIKKLEKEILRRMK